MVREINKLGDRIILATLGVEGLRGRNDKDKKADQPNLRVKEDTNA